MTVGSLIFERPEPVEYEMPGIVKRNHPGSKVFLRYGFGPLPSSQRNKRIFFFDIDNCLYNKSTQIHDMMQEKIHEYFKKNLSLSDEEAEDLHVHYYQTYGLALEGLVRNHKVDALKYNAEVDDSLDLGKVLLYNGPLREMLIRIRRSGDFDFMWLVTNAYKNHSLKVISLLGLGDIFDGLTFCDYTRRPLICKPMEQYYSECFTNLNIDYRNSSVLKNQAYIDDSESNVKAVFRLGLGTVIHLIELDLDFNAIRKKPDFEHYYGPGDNSDPSKVRIVRNILDLEKVCK